MRTFLFTDIAGSTRRWEAHPELMGEALSRHDTIVVRAVQERAGVVFKHTGDGIAATFDDPASAVAAAVDLQRGLDGEDFRAVGGIRVRAGVHSGQAEERDGDWFGPVVNRCARLMSAAAGGQILVSDAVAASLGPTPADGMRLRDLGEHVLRDLGAAERIHQVDAVGLQTEFPALRTLSAYRTNLTPQRTTFIGREREVRRVRELLGSSTLLTVTGVGGGGKTRLALQVASELLDGFPDGVFVVELAPIRGSLTVPRVVATAVGCFDPLVESVAGEPEAAARAMVEHLARVLADRSLLLVLDNCEHQLDAVSAIVEALQRACPDVVVLATSREPLGVAGEQRYEIPPLRLSETTSAHDHPEAVALFEERARAVRSDFELTSENLGAVEEICQRLDGIPLAVELAAARVATLAPAQIATRLDDALGLLHAPVSRGDARHRTLESTLAWSYEQLEPDEQRVLCRLAVFRGGCTLEAAESVCGLEPLQEKDVLGLLEQLHAKSLVFVESSPAVARYRLLEPVLQFAEARLPLWGDEDEVREAHARWCLGQVHDARAMANIDAALVARLQLEEENLRSAFDRAQQRGDVELVPPLALYTYWYWRAKADHPTAVRWLQTAMDLLGPEPSPRRAGVGLLGTILEVMGETARASELLEESLAINKALNYDRGLGWSYGGIARLRAITGDRAGSEEAFTNAEIHLTAAEDRAGLSWARFNEGWIRLWWGDVGGARRCARSVAADPQAPGDPQALAVVLLGLLDGLDGDWSAAGTRIEAGLRDIVSVTERAYTLPMVARYELATEERYHTGLRRLREGIELLRATGQIEMLPWALEAAAAAATDDPEQAARLWGAADKLLDRTGTHVPGPAGDHITAERAAVRQRLGSERFDRYHGDGQLLFVEQAVDLALELLRDIEDPSGADA